MSSLSLPIETDRLILRTFERSDLDGLSAYHALPSMQRYVFSRTRDAARWPAPSISCAAMSACSAPAIR